MNFFVDVESLNKGLDFGLNRGLTLSSLKGGEGSYGPQLNLVLSKEGKMVTQQWYSHNTDNITEVYVSKEHGGGNGEKTSDPEHPDFVAYLEKLQNQFGATMNHILGVIMPNVDDRRNFLNGVESVDALFQKFNNLDAQSEIAAGNVLVDVFLQYPKDKNKEYQGVELPKNVAQGGRFIQRHNPEDTLKKVTKNGALTIVNQNGEEVFHRNANWMSKPMAHPADAVEATQTQDMDFSIE